jgi:hypothetical protein
VLGKWVIFIARDFASDGQECSNMQSLKSINLVEISRANLGDALHVLKPTYKAGKLIAPCSAIIPQISLQSTATAGIRDSQTWRFRRDSGRRFTCDS